MRKFTLEIIGLVLILYVGILTGCNPQEEYYKRPEWLEPPIYQQLQDSGIFTSYLKCVDKAGYTNALQGAGYYTVFAPTDDAFKAFLTEKGISSVDAITEQMAKQIVTYSMCMSAASYDQIDDFQSNASNVTIANTANVAFKRTTSNYKWVYSDYDVQTGTTKDVIDMNAVESEVNVPGVFEITDYNRKNIPFFTSNFMAKKNLTAADYNYFYPNILLTDFNVADARVIKKDIWAENGVVHVVDKVILPLNNLEETLAQTNECSEFRNLINKYLVTYTFANDAFQLKYEQSSGVRKDVYIKDYPRCSFAPNCENYLRYGGGLMMDVQIDGWTLFAPSNEAMEKFYSEKFFKYGYKSLDEMPSFVLQEFVNAHMFRTTVWPSKFDFNTNPYGEEARFDASSDVIKKEISSNGLFYAVNKVQATNAFTTVLGDVILNPEYSLMYQALNDLEPLVSTLKNPISKYLLFLITNDQMTAAGFRYNPASLAWQFTDAVDRPDLGTNVNLALARFINLHIVLLTNEMFSNGVDILNGSGLLKTYNDEYIKYNKGEIYAGGNVAGKRPKIISKVDSKPKNGQSYTMDRAFLFSNGNIGNFLSVSSLQSATRATTLLRYLEKIATASYVNDEGATVYVSNCVYNNTTKAIKDISNTDVITVFVPNDPAMTSAVTNKVIKALASFAPDGNVDVLNEDNMSLDRFVKYHIVKGNVILGEDFSGKFTSYRKLDDGTFATLDIQGVKGSPGSLTITDNQGRTAKVIVSATTTYNILGNRAIVHVIDNYLTY